MCDLGRLRVGGGITTVATGDQFLDALGREAQNEEATDCHKQNSDPIRCVPGDDIVVH